MDNTEFKEQLRSIDGKISGLNGGLGGILQKEIAPELKEIVRQLKALVKIKAVIHAEKINRVRILEGKGRDLDIPETLLKDAYDEFKERQ